MMRDLLRLLGAVAVIMAVCIAFVRLTDANRETEMRDAASRSAPSAFAASAKAPAPDRIVAKVNGETISYKELRAGIGQDMFSLMADDADQRRLEFLINLKSLTQYLRAHDVVVAPDDVEREVANLRANPPASGGCPCCSYASLDAFLSANFMTMADLYRTLHNEIGMNAHVAALWNVDYPPGAKRDAWVSAQRARIEENYVRMSHIFFKTAQQPDFASDPDDVRKRANEKALDAWKRVQSGAAFAEVAKKYSEDSNSRSKGGDLGYLEKGTFGNDVEAVYERLKPGECSQPVESPWGFHIIRRGVLAEDDLVDILRNEYQATKKQELMDLITKTAKIEKFPL